MQPTVQVTITRLPTSLSIVSIPRQRLDALSHPILRTLLQPNPAFLSITCNAIELSLVVAEPEFLSAFDTIARADQHSSLTKGSNGSPQILEPIEISRERWCVLQIDSHSDQLDDAGARVSELSAPLAAAGISILYQSSYTSDYILVKERRITEVMSLFAAAGFALYAADPNLLTASLAPSSSPAVTRERSGSAPLPSSRSSSSSKSSSHHPSSTGKSHEKVMSTPTPASQSAPKTKSAASVLPNVRVLAPDLVCVGLVDDAADQWVLKIVKLISFPDLIPLPATVASSSSSSYTSRNDLSSVEEKEDDGYFSHSPSPTFGAQNEVGLAPVAELQDETEGQSADEDLKDVNVSRSPARQVPSRLDALPSPIAWLDPDAPQVTDEPEVQGSGDQVNLQQDPIEPRIPFFSFIRTPEGSSLTAGAKVLATLFPPSERHMVICGGELDAADCEADAARYTPASSEPPSPVVENGHNDSLLDYDSDEESDDDDVDADGHPLLSALQVDLRSAGLDTHGLVHRFSRALARGGVNHMYASTLRSANLLVPTGRGGRGARRASGLLRGC